MIFYNSAIEAQMQRLFASLSEKGKVRYAGINAYLWSMAVLSIFSPCLTLIDNTPEFSGKKPVIKQSGAETFQRSFPQNSGKFCTLFYTNRFVVSLLNHKHLSTNSE